MTGFFKKMAADERGASSILVIFMMMILVTLGALAIASANANYKLSQRALGWNAMYYDLDAKAEEFISALDGRLAEAEMMACDYMKSKSYQDAVHTDIPEQIQTEISSGIIGGDLKYDEILSNVYMYYVDKYLEDLISDYPELQVYASDRGAFIDYIFTEISVKSELDELCGLNVSVWVEPIEYVVTETGSNLSIVRANDNLRYRIEDWYEHQEPLQDESSGTPEIELWDGSL